MPRWLKVLTIVGIVPAALFVWMVVWSWDKSGSWREARELHVETPNGIVSARNVREVSMWRTMAFPGPEAGGVSTEVHGEALGSRDNFPVADRCGEVDERQEGGVQLVSA